MRRLILSTAVSCLLSACVHGPTPMPAPPISVPPPANTTAPPQQLPLPRSGRVPDLEANHLAVARLYHQLANQHCRLLAHLQIHPPACRMFMTTTESALD
jgi:hypothetical protein